MDRDLVKQEVTAIMQQSSMHILHFIILLVMISLSIILSSCSNPKDRSVKRLEKLYEKVCITDRNYQEKSKDYYINELEIVQALLSQYSMNDHDAKYINQLLKDCSESLSVSVKPINTEIETSVGGKVSDLVWTKEELESANTAKDVDYLTDDEKQVIMLCNLARCNGPKFTKTYLDKWLERKTKNEYTRSLYEDLSKISKLPMLKPNEILYSTATKHAIDMGVTGQQGHNSSDGTSFGKRVMKAYGPHLIGENCSYGVQNPEDIVILLLIDDGVKSLGHRKNILNEQFNEIGVSIKPHKSIYKYNSVLDFGCSD